MDRLKISERLLHVVVAEDDVIDATVALSVHEPAEAHGWDLKTGFRTRKKVRR